MNLLAATFYELRYKPDYKKFLKNFIPIRKSILHPFKLLEIFFRSINVWNAKWVSTIPLKVRRNLFLKFRFYRSQLRHFEIKSNSPNSTLLSSALLFFLKTVSLSLVTHISIHRVPLFRSNNYFSCQHKIAFHAPPVYSL